MFILISFSLAHADEKVNPVEVQQLVSQLTIVCKSIPFKDLMGDRVCIDLNNNKDRITGYIKTPSNLTTLKNLIKDRCKYSTAELCKEM